MCHEIEVKLGIHTSVTITFVNSNCMPEESIFVINYSLYLHECCYKPENYLSITH